MEKEIFRGKPVLHCVDETDSFYADLFCMLDDHIGPSCIIETDDFCRYHFHSLVDRLCDICYCHCPSADVSEVLLLYLGGSASSDTSN